MTYTRNRWADVAAKPGPTITLTIARGRWDSKGQSEAQREGTRRAAWLTESAGGRGRQRTSGQAAAAQQRRLGGRPGASSAAHKSTMAPMVIQTTLA
jgi:hypothetical protein